MIEINGQPTEVPEEFGSLRLLDFLRDVAGLTGTKFGCGIGQCGACTVHLDGVAVRSCQVVCAAAEGHRITTIEGLAARVHNDEDLHPVQQAWVDESVPQCGYCQAGQIMSASALLEANPSPSDAEIETAMNGNLCRCGTYGRIRKAIRRAAGTRSGSDVG